MDLHDNAIKQGEEAHWTLTAHLDKQYPGVSDLERAELYLERLRESPQRAAIMLFFMDVLERCGDDLK